MQTVPRGTAAPTQRDRVEAVKETLSGIGWAAGEGGAREGHSCSLGSELQNPNPER